jgi:RNA polymerase sigma factor (sigma-70 family)
VSGRRTLDELLRSLAPQVLAALVRRYGGFDAAEDAVQEALATAAVQWPRDGVPAQPRGWLITVATRRLIEQFRSDAARRGRELRAWQLQPTPVEVADRDDTLRLLLLCCHRSLRRPAQVALTLRAVGGLTTAEIARAYLLPEATIAQRISRAKRRIQDSGARFDMPDAAETGDRLDAVMQVLYLIFTEGSTVSAGATVNRVDLTTEAIRLTRQLVAALPGHGEAAGLLALMLLTDARRPARTTPDGELVPLAEQDRGRWDRHAIAEGTALVNNALATTPIGPYQLQAAIAAVHDEAGTAQATDWKQILVLYDLLGTIAPGPIVTVNRVVALAMVQGATAGLAALDTAVAAEPALAGYYRVDAVRGYLLDLAGDRAAARQAYARAAAGSLSLPEQRHLRSRADDSYTPPPLE